MSEKVQLLRNVDALRESYARQRMHYERCSICQQHGFTPEYNRAALERALARHFANEPVTQERGDYMRAHLGERVAAPVSRPMVDGLEGGERWYERFWSLLVSRWR